MQLKLIIAGLIIVAIIVIVVFVAGSSGHSGSVSFQNNSSSGPSEQENAQEETAEAVAPDSVAGVDTGLYMMWMWVISLVAIVVLATIIAVLFVRWRRSPDDEYVPEERYYRDRRRRRY